MKNSLTGGKAENQDLIKRETGKTFVPFLDIKTHTEWMNWCVRSTYSTHDDFLVTVFISTAFSLALAPFPFPCSILWCVNKTLQALLMESVELSHFNWRLFFDVCSTWRWPDVNLTWPSAHKKKISKSLSGRAVMQPIKCSSSSPHTMYFSPKPPSPSFSPSATLSQRQTEVWGKNPFTVCALEQLLDNAWQIRVTSVMNLS